MTQPLSVIIEPLRSASQRLTELMDQVYAAGRFHIGEDGTIYANDVPVGTISPGEETLASMSALVELVNWLMLNQGLLATGLRDSSRVEAVFHPDMDPLDFNMPADINPVESVRHHGGRSTMDLAIDHVLAAKGQGPLMSNWGV